MSGAKTVFEKFNPSFYNEYHKWEVMVFLDDGRILQETWEKENPEEFESPEDQYEAMIDFVRGCRFSDTEYSVFMDGELTDL